MAAPQTDYLTVYPALRLDHLERLTDDTGVVQHAVRSVPDRRHGYSIDDQARALIAVLAHARLSGRQRAPRAAYTYLAYLRSAARSDHWFHNFLAYDRTWQDERGSEDAYGRAMWALGYTRACAPDQGLAAAAADLFAEQAPLMEHLRYVRACAFSLFGLHFRLKSEPDEKLLGTMDLLGNRLLASYDSTAGPDWQWFEDELTYCNAKLPAALLLAYEITGNERFRSAGLEALAWLFSVLTDTQGIVRLVGQDGWYPRDGVRAAFDEQCVDAQNLVEAALIAERVSGDTRWRRQALTAFDWFMGRNVNGASLIDPITWGCYDGITRTRLNRNMGAESTICYLLAYLQLAEAGALTLDGAVAQIG